MPPKNSTKGKGNSKNPDDWKSFEFVTINLNADQKAEFKKLYKASAAQFLDRIPDFTLHGYKFSVSFDSNNDTYIASMTCRNAQHANYNLVLTSRSDDFWEALALNVFKTVHLCADDIWADAGDTGTWG